MNTMDKLFVFADISQVLGFTDLLVIGGQMSWLPAARTNSTLGAYTGVAWRLGQAAVNHSRRVGACLPAGDGLTAE